jgi:hypothetical protein
MILYQDTIPPIINKHYKERKRSSHTHPLFDLRKGGFLVNSKFTIHGLHSKPCERTRPYGVNGSCLGYDKFQRLPVQVLLLMEGKSQIKGEFVHCLPLGESSEETRPYGVDTKFGFTANLNGSSGGN